jgi:DNA repair protein RAD50
VLSAAQVEWSTAGTVFDDAQAAQTDARAAQEGVEGELQEQQSLQTQIRHLQAVLDADTEMAQLKSRVAQLDTDIAAAAGGAPDVQERHQRATDDLSRLQQESAKLAGRLEELEGHQAELQSRMGDVRFKCVRLAHHKAQVDFTTAKVATQDLNKYYKAVEKALAQYHAAKMRNINERVVELWRATYRGQDIESIELRSDAEEAAGGGRSDNKAFNYRVVMIKGDTELDMRGRCSAGQKVLASLVIRLALAETFSVSCGFITLDEPTTNLDVQNRTGLAQAICRLVAARRSQKNFQLVVITHDEDFVAELGRQQVELAGAGAVGEMAPFYYRVTRERNSRGQFVSRIQQQDWA